jgi:hypothetical protein
MGQILLAAFRSKVHDEQLRWICFDHEDSITGLSVTCHTTFVAVFLRCPIITETRSGFSALVAGPLCK